MLNELTRLTAKLQRQLVPDVGYARVVDLVQELVEAMGHDLWQGLSICAESARRVPASRAMENHSVLTCAWLDEIFKDVWLRLSRIKTIHVVLKAYGGCS